MTSQNPKYKRKLAAKISLYSRVNSLGSVIRIIYKGKWKSFAFEDNPRMQSYIMSLVGRLEFFEEANVVLGEKA